MKYTAASVCQLLNNVSNQQDGQGNRTIVPPEN